RSAFQHVAHAIDTPRRNPFDTFSLSDRRGAKRSCGSFGQVIGEIGQIAAVFILLDHVPVYLVHRDEPLRRGAKNHRVLATPAMRITMVVLLAEEQHATLAHELNNAVVRVKHALTGEVLDFGREASRFVDRTVDLQTVAFADHEVVVTMTRRSMNAT